MPKKMSADDARRVETDNQNKLYNIVKRGEIKIKKQTTISYFSVFKQNICQDYNCALTIKNNTLI